MSTKKVSDRDYNIFQKILWGFNPTEVRKKRYNNEHEDKCPLCGESDTTYHFLRCQSLHQSPRGERGFKKLKSDCAKLGVSLYYGTSTYRHQKLTTSVFHQELTKNIN